MCKIVQIYTLLHPLTAKYKPNLPFYDYSKGKARFVLPTASRQ